MQTLWLQAPPEFAYYTPYLNLTSTRKAIHVGSLGYGLQSDAVEQALINVRVYTFVLNPETLYCRWTHCLYTYLTVHVYRTSCRQ